MTAESLATLARVGNGRTSLALTARRASALGWPRPGAAPRGGSGVVSLPLAGIGDAEIMRGLIDPTCAPARRLPAAVVAPRQESDGSFAAAAVTLVQARPAAAGGADRDARAADEAQPLDVLAAPSPAAAGRGSPRSPTTPGSPR